MGSGVRMLVLMACASAVGTDTTSAFCTSPGVYQGALGHADCGRILAPALAARSLQGPPACVQARRGREARLRMAESAYTASHHLTASDLAAGPPVIDVSALLAPGGVVTAGEVVEEIAKAATSWGFFQVVGHGVPDAEIDAFDGGVKRFFAQDKDTKYKIKRNSGNSRGYFDDELTKQTRDWKEAIDIGAQDGDLDGKSAVDGYNQWPDGDPAFRADITAYFAQMEHLSRTLCRALAVGLGEKEGFFDPLFDKHTSYLRINHYPPCPNPVGADFPLHSPDAETEGYLAINRHTDAGVLTVLRQRHDEPHSLQVFISDDADKDHESRDGQWVTVSPHPGAFTINVGDMMQVYSNDRYVAPLHRVLANRERARYSAPFFFNPPYATDCAPLKTLGAPVYDVVNWGEFRRRRFEGDFADVGKEVQIAQFRK